MEKQAKIKANLTVFIVASILLITLFVPSVFTLSLTTFNNSLTTENLTFTGNQNITRYLSISKEANVTSAYMNLSGYGIEQLPYTNITKSSASSDGAWVNTTNGYDNDFDTFTTNDYVAINFNMYNEFIVGQSYIKNITWQVKLQEASGNGITETCYVYNYTSSTYVVIGDCSMSIGPAETKFFVIYENQLSDFLSGNTIKFKVSYTNVDTNDYGAFYESQIIVSYFKYPTSPYLEIGTPDGIYEWNHTGKFNSTFSPSMTTDLSSILNNATNDGLCDCTGCVLTDNNCDIPFQFHSDTIGIIEYRDIDIVYSTRNFSLIDFVTPTPSNNTITTSREAIINISIIESNLDTFIWNWNGTNFSFYDDSLVLMYNFDNVSSIGDTTTTSIDLSGYGNEGTHNGALNRTNAGKYGGAIEFDGFDDVITTGKQVIDGSTSLTVSFWLYANEIQQARMIAEGTDFYIRLTASGNVDVASPGLDDGYFSSSAGAVETNQWYHLMFIYDGTTKFIYRNGAIIKQEIATGTITSNSATFSIGSYSGAGDYLNGTLDEVRIYNRALSPDEIYQLYISNLNKYDTDKWAFYVNQSNLTDSLYTYFGYAKNTLENSNITEVRTIQIDTILPIVSVSYPSNGSIYGSATIDINYSVSELNPETCWWSNSSGLVNNTLTNCGTNITGLTWDEGSNTIGVWANDSAGNENSTSVTFIVDTILPLIDFVTPTPDADTNQSQTSLIINFSITELNLNKLIYNWNGTNYSIYDDSLVLMYNFDNVSALGENNSDVKDLSGYGNDGQIVGAVYNLTGKYGKGMQFDGIDDKIKISHDESLLISTGGTITFWANPLFSSAASKPTVLAKAEGNNGLNGYQIEYYTQGRIYFKINDVGGSSSTNLWTQNQEDFITVTVNSTGWVKWYRNGEFYSEIQGGSPTGITTTNDMFIGSHWFGTARWFNGTIDEVRIWNRSLSEDEIYQQYISNLNKYDTDKWRLYVNQSKNASDGLDDGRYTYFTWINDSAGNSNISETRGITIDATPVVITLEIPADNSFNNSATQNFTANITDNVGIKNATLHIYNSTGDEVVTDSQTYGAGILSVVLGFVQTLVDDIYTWFYEAFNWAGTSSIPSANYTFTVDTTSPQITITSPIDGFNYSISDIYFNITSNENLSYVNITFGTASYNFTLTTNTSGAVYRNSSMPDGFYTAIIQFNDTLGNADTKTIGFRIDTILPVVIIDYPLNGSTHSINVTHLNYTASDINLQTCIFSNNTGLTNRTATGGNFVDVNLVLNAGNYVWMLACNDSAGNLNISFTNFTVDFDAFPEVNLSGPIDGFNSTDFTHTFEVNSSDDSGLDNVTIIIWNSTNDEIFRNLSTTSGTFVSSSASYTFNDFGIYHWNALAVSDVGQESFGSSNYTLIVYNDTILISELTATAPFPDLGEYINLIATTSIGSQTKITFCNFTAVHPGGIVLFDNEQGTNLTDIFNSTSTIFINSTGNYDVNITCMNQFGTQASATKTFSVGYNVTTNPSHSNIWKFVAVNSSNELRAYNITFFDDSRGNITYNVSVYIDWYNNFTTTLNGAHSISLISNSSDSSSSPFTIEFIINASRGIANGTYDGNITFYNATMNQLFMINFSYGIQPPSGIAEIFNLSDDSCVAISTGACAFSVDELEIDFARDNAYKVKNTGLYRIKNCTPEFKGPLDVSWVSFTNSSFSLEVNDSMNFSAIFDPDVSASAINYTDYLTIGCTDGSFGGFPIDTPPNNRAYVFLNIDPSTGTTPGAPGAGAEPLTEEQVISLIEAAEICGNNVCSGKETFFSCSQDCGGFNFDNLILNCFESTATEPDKCLFKQEGSQALILVIAFVATMIVLSIVSSKKTKRSIIRILPKAFRPKRR